MNRPSPWRTTPLGTRIVFMLAVFFIFAGIAFVSDVMGLGRTPAPRLAAGVVLNGVFAMGYAAAGVILRKKFWMALAPILIVQFVLNGWLVHQFPDIPLPIPLSAEATTHLHQRITWVGAAIIACVTLGYTGLVFVSIHEARRYYRTETEKATLESEMAAAREVQRVMVPEELPAVAGYIIETAYRPAAEVGGDFYQVIPLQSGRSMAVIGDVSGKGLPAAMIVSLIVGMLRTISSYVEEPAEVLAKLNRCLCGRMRGGFVTCLAVRMDSGGTLTLASAGHPSPYLNGREVSLAGSTPLGLREAESYGQAAVEMRNGDHMVLLTDGIPEARNDQGTIFGFSRVESLLRDGASVRTIAESARQYGQNDDLTVISIARAA